MTYWLRCPCKLKLKMSCLKYCFSKTDVSMGLRIIRSPLFGTYSQNKSKCIHGYDFPAPYNSILQGLIDPSVQCSMCAFGECVAQRSAKVCTCIGSAQINPEACNIRINNALVSMPVESLQLLQRVRNYFSMVTFEVMHGIGCYKFWHSLSSEYVLQCKHAVSSADHETCKQDTEHQSQSDSTPMLTLSKHLALEWATVNATEP